MKFLLVILAVLLIPVSAYPGEDPGASPVLGFFPSGLQFAPLKAGNQEPRMGLFKFSNSGEMDVEVGNSKEILDLSYPSSGFRFSLGIDFFGRAFITGSDGLRLQLDAIDGFFGGHLSASREIGYGMLLGRLRILHQSSHFADGHLASRGGGWIDGLAPIPYTRDFGDLTLAEYYRFTGWSVRPYAGLSYATLVRPAEQQRLAYLAGIELAVDGVMGRVLDRPSSLYCAYHLAVDGDPAYAASSRLQIGMKLGEWYGSGLDIYAAFYNGRHIFSEYLGQRLDTIGFGFMVDFF